MIVNLGRTGSLNLRVTSDYVAMLALAQPKSLGSCQALPSITDLFAACPGRGGFGWPDARRHDLSPRRSTRPMTRDKGANNPALLAHVVKAMTPLLANVRVGAAAPPATGAPSGSVAPAMAEGGPPKATLTRVRTFVQSKATAANPEIGQDQPLVRPGLRPGRGAGSGGPGQRDQGAHRKRVLGRGLPAARPGCKANVEIVFARRRAGDDGPPWPNAARTFWATTTGAIAIG